MSDVYRGSYFVTLILILLCVVLFICGQQLDNLAHSKLERGAGIVLASMAFGLLVGVLFHVAFTL